MVQNDIPAEEEKPRRRRSGPKPRPESEQAPEPTPALNERERERIAQIADDALFLTRDEQACVHLCMEESREAAAVRLKWPLSQVVACLRQPHVKLYAIEYRETFMKRLAKKRADSLSRVGVSRASVQERLMQIAMMEPAETRGSVDAQVKALTQLSNILGMTKDDPLKDKSDAELMEIVERGRSNATAVKVQ